MSYLVLARKYRPQTFEDVVGQSHVTTTLQNAIRTQRVAHALLFAGPRGVGKTSVARILAKAMNCEKGTTATPCNDCQSCHEITQGIAVDVLEIDGASNRGIGEIRELRENIKYLPNRGRYKIYIIDEVHMLTGEAFNALLKTLEEPPPHVLFILATTEPGKIPGTILSRCQRHEFRRIGHENLVASLEAICQKASFELGKSSLHLIAQEAGGSMRDALSLLDQVMAYSEKGAKDDEVLDVLGAVDREAVFELSAALMARDAASALKQVNVLYNRGHDLKRLHRQILVHFRHLMVVKMGLTSELVDLGPRDIARMREQIETTSLESLNQTFSTLFEAEPVIRMTPDPKLALEALLIKVVQFPPVPSLESMIERLEAVAREVGSGSPPAARSQVMETAEPPMEPVEPPMETMEPELPDQKPARHSDKVVEQVCADPAGSGSEDLAQTWRQLLGVFEKRCRSIIPSLEKSVLSKVGATLVEITVRGNSFHAARLKDARSLSAIKAVCRDFFGRDMEISIVEAPEKAAGKDPGIKTDKTRRLRKEALGHPVVMDALEVFGGRIVDVKILQ